MSAFSRGAPPERSLELLDLVEGHLLGQVVLALVDAGFPEAAREPVQVEPVAKKLGVNPKMLAGVLEYVAARTTLVERRPDGYVATGLHAEARFALRQYVGAYGPVAQALLRILRGEVDATSTIATRRQADAFAALEGPGVALLTQVVVELAPRHVLDLGCGSGALLCQVASALPRLTGVGIDSSPDMCRSAAERAESAGIGERLSFLLGDAGSPRIFATVQDTGCVELVVASSLLNAFFAEGVDRAIAWLAEVARIFPRRLLLVSDYYGRLGSREPPWPRRSAMHDLVQLISGQGVPPPDQSAWEHIYQRAGVQLRHVMEDTSETGFIHCVQL